MFIHIYIFMYVCIYIYMYVFVTDVIPSQYVSIYNNTVTFKDRYIDIKHPHVQRYFLLDWSNASIICVTKLVIMCIRYLVKWCQHTGTESNLYTYLNQILLYLKWLLYISSLCKKKNYSTIMLSTYITYIFIYIYM